ncbi:MAG: glycoside hydrolase family 18 protein [Anaerolineae bacterium]|nr:glycoside hydrolase family 18 protein [Phycisphaerae bacterium]
MKRKSGNAVIVDALESRTLFSAEVVGYLPSYHASNEMLNNIDWESLTHLNYFSAMPDTDGKLLMPISYDDYQNPDNRVLFDPTDMINVGDDADTHDVTMSIVIGGAGLDYNFSTMMASSGARSTFVTEVINLCRENNLDGVDFDFEVLNPTAVDRTNYGTLIAQLDAAAPDLILSTAVNPKKLWLAPNYDTSEFMLNSTAVQHLDRIGIMTYDYTPGDSSHSPVAETKADMQLWQSYVEGIQPGSKSKLLFGVPFYGRAGSVWGPQSDPNLTRDMAYSDLLNEQFADHPGWAFDPSANSLNLAIPGYFNNQPKNWYFDGANLIADKTKYSIDQHYGGVMIWDLGHDHYVNSAPSQYALMPRIEQAVMQNFATIDSAGHVEAGSLSRNDVFTLSVSGSNMIISLGSASKSFPLSSVTSVTIDPKGGDDTVNINAAINKPLTIVLGAGVDTINVNAGAVTFNNDVQEKAWSRTSLFVAAGASVTFNTNVTLASLVNNGTINLPANGNRTMYTTALQLGAAGKLDLNDNNLIFDYDSASGQLAMVQSLINAARNGGSWTGTHGLMSTSAKNRSPKNTTLGAMEATAFKAMNGQDATFGGQSVDNTAVLVKYTYYGDADFNGVVDFDDYSRTDAGFNNNRIGWQNGDFDGNGVVDFDDYSLIDQAFNTQNTALRPGVPRVMGKGATSMR